MAESAGSRMGGTSPHFNLISDDRLGSGTSTRGDLLRSFTTYEDFFNELETQPEADIRERFLSARALRARYVERLVRGGMNAWRELQRDVQNGTANSTDEEHLKRLDVVMLNLDEVLRWYSQINEDDSKAAKAPIVDQYFMDYTVRYHMDKPGQGLLGPNAEAKTLYGSVGDRASASLSATRGCESDPIRRLILDKLLHPFNHYLHVPLQKLYKIIVGDKTGLPTQQLGGGTLDTIMVPLEFSIATGCFAGSLTLLYNLKSTKARLIAAPFMSLVCAIPVVFMSRQAKECCTLMAGVWAVLSVVVFLSAANVASRIG